MLERLFICYARLVNIALLLLPFLLFFYIVDIEVVNGNHNAVQNVSNAVETQGWVYTCTEDGVSKELILLNIPKKADIVIFKGEKFAYSEYWVKDHCTYEWKSIPSK